MCSALAGRSGLRGLTQCTACPPASVFPPSSTLVCTWPRSPPQELGLGPQERAPSARELSGEARGCGSWALAAVTGGLGRPALVSFFVTCPFPAGPWVLLESAPGGLPNRASQQPVTQPAGASLESSSASEHMDLSRKGQLAQLGTHLPVSWEHLPWSGCALRHD